MEVKIGTYAIYKGLTLRLIKKSKNKLILQGIKSSDLINLGFSQYSQPELEDKLFISVSKEKLDSVFHSTAYCKYKELKFTLDGAFRSNDKTYRIWPSFQSFEKLGLDHKDDNTHYWVKEDDLDEIWEERRKISDFPFKVKKIKFLKK